MKTFVHKIKLLSCTLILLLSASLFNSCGFYSFSGTSIAPEVKTVSIEYFQNMAPLIVPSLSNTFIDVLRNKFVRQTRLDLIQSDGDLELSGEIRGYDVAPVAITGEEFASKNRLTIRIKVKFINKIDPSQNFDQEFSAYEDFPGEQSIDQAQNALIDGIVETLAENIFNASVASW